MPRVRHATWPGRYDNVALPVSQRSNHPLREEKLAMRLEHPAGPTAVVNQGANPGMISSLLHGSLRAT